MFLGNFGRRDERIVQTLLRFSGNGSGKIVPNTTSGRRVATFELDAIGFYIAANCTHEALRFFARNFSQFNGVRRGPNGGPIPDLINISNDQLPQGFCIYAPDYRGKV